MRFIALSVCLMTVLTGCGFEWFPSDETSTSSISITTTTLADAPTGLSYSQTLVATGGVSPYHWTLASSSLSFPTGLNLSDGGIISGIPTAPTTVPATTPVYTFTIKVADSASTPAIATKNYSISTPITASDSTGKVFAAVLSFDASRGMVVTITNTDSIPHTIQLIAANYDPTTGLEINNSAFNLTPVTVLAGASPTITDSHFGTFTVNNWRIKSVSFI